MTTSVAASPRTTPAAPEARRGLEAHHLPILGTLAVTVAAGVGIGALALRTGAAGWGAQALRTGALRGAGLGAFVGAALLGIDHASGGGVQAALHQVTLDRRAQIGFVLRHPAQPWVGPAALGAAGDARTAQRELFGELSTMDGPQDAFRHAYGAALLALRAMRDHGMEPGEAGALTAEAGAAHEADGRDNNDAHSRAMDDANNAAGVALLGDARPVGDEQPDADGFVSERSLRLRVLHALADGQLEVVDRATTGAPAPRATDAHDLPPGAYGRI